MNRPSSTRRTRGLAVTLVALAGLLTGCMGIDVTSVRRVEAHPPPPDAEAAVAVGRIQFMVDGRPMDYGLLNKPHLSLHHRQRDVLMSSPETRADGSYEWRMPAGDYRVAVVFGGMTPSRQALRLPSGQVIRVNGLVDPGATFTLRAGTAVDLGTLVVEVETEPARGLLSAGERVFARFIGLRVEPLASVAMGHASPPVSSPMQVVAHAAAASTQSRAPNPASVLAPLLPLLLR